MDLKEGTKYDDGKSRMDLIPPEAVTAMGHVLGFGAEKYEDRNWELGMDWGRLFAATQRHLWAWANGEEDDNESNFPHLWHAFTTLGMLLALVERNDGIDSRFSFTKKSEETQKRG